MLNMHNQGTVVNCETCPCVMCISHLICNGQPVQVDTIPKTIYVCPICHQDKVGGEAKV